MGIAFDVCIAAADDPANGEDACIDNKQRGTNSGQLCTQHSECPGSVCNTVTAKAPRYVSTEPQANCE